MISLEQIRAARAMLGLKQQELATKANVSMGTLNNIERGVQTDPKVSTLRAIQTALEAEGIEFIGEGSGNRGILLRVAHTASSSPLILIIDDSNIDRDLYKLWLANHPRKNFKIVEAGDAKDGYEMFLKHKPDCIILDFMMYGKDGFQLLVEMKKEHTKIPPIIFVTATPNAAVKKDVLAIGAHSYLDKKALTKEKLYEAVEKALV